LKKKKMKICKHVDVFIDRVNCSFTDVKCPYFEGTTMMFMCGAFKAGKKNQRTPKEREEYAKSF